MRQISNVSVCVFVQAKDGKTYYKDADNLYWRVSVFIPNAVTKEEVNPESAFCCGETFGNFQNMLVDLKEPFGRKQSLTFTTWNFVCASCVRL